MCFGGSPATAPVTTPNVSPANAYQDVTATVTPPGGVPMPSAPMTPKPALPIAAIRGAVTDQVAKVLK